MPKSLSKAGVPQNSVSPCDSLKPLFDKVVSESDAAARMAQLARPVVFTNGVFDILHRGHVTYLAQARALGGSLIVALNTDASVRRLGKAPGRPINTEADRAVVIAALASVDAVTFFDATTPLSLIEQLRPDIYVKGGDYDIEALEETRLVRSWGGQAAALPFVEGFSTTSVLDRATRQ